MKFINLALVSAAVGAITMAPTQLLPATAGLLGSATSLSQSITTGNYGAVAGASSAATAASSHVVTPATSACSTTRSTTNNNTASASTTIALTSTLGPGPIVEIGMIVTGSPGLAADTKVTNVTATLITISRSTIAQVSKNITLTFSGCYQSFFNVNNIGSLALISFQISQVVSTTTAGEKVILQTCSGTWAGGSSEACSGTITSLSTNNGATGSRTFSVALSAWGGTTQLRALGNTSGQSSTISITIARVNVRAAVTTNS